MYELTTYYKHSINSFSGLFKDLLLINFELEKFIVFTSSLLDWSLEQPKLAKRVEVINTLHGIREASCWPLEI